MPSSVSPLVWRFRPLEHQIDDAFARWIETPWARRPVDDSTVWPAIDLYDVGEAYLLLADLPGVAETDIELQVQDHQLRFCGLRWSTGFVRQGRRLVAERRCGRFCRRFTLDEPVDVDGTQHGHANGIYWARLPKRCNDHPTDNQH